MNPLIIGKNLASIIRLQAASASFTATAGGSGDNTQVTGITIDRETLDDYGADTAITGAPPIGCVFGIAYQAALGATNTLTIKNALLEDSADGSTWATVYDQTGATAPTAATWPAAGVVDTGAAGGSTQRGVVVFGTDIQKCRRYIRFLFTPDLSASSTDTLVGTVVAILSGFSELPQNAI